MLQHIIDDIEAKLEERGLTLKALCAGAEIAPSTWTRWSSGKITPSLPLLARVRTWLLSQNVEVMSLEILFRAMAVVPEVPRDSVAA